MFESAIDFLNRERGVNFSPVSEAVFEGYAVAGKGRIKLCIDLGNGYPNDFPLIRVLDNKKFIPHVSVDGALCLVNKEEVMVKTNMPNELLVDSYDRAIAILGMNPTEQKKEIFREFRTYWENHSVPGIRLYLNLPESTEHEYQEYTVIGPNQNQLVVSSDIDESKTLLINNMECPADKTEKYKIPCTRIRLREMAIPPCLNEESTWKSIRTYIQDNITAGQKRRFERFLAIKTRAIHQMILLVIPSNEGDQNACIWIHSQRSRQRISIKNTQWCKVDAIGTSRIDQRYMLVRGGAETEICSKTVLLIGAGSVGGFLAENLCQCGIGTLDILDKDRLSIDNVHRHVLGFHDAVKDAYKADLLKAHLEARFPHVEIDSMNFVNRSAETVLGQPDRLRNYDLVISATGNPNVDLAINDALHKLDNYPPLIVCFNEPYGIGGHAIAALPSSACLRCAYSDPISGSLVPFLGSFVEPDQLFSKTMSGCASSFVEYSVLDSQQTAIIATRLSLEILNGMCNRSKLVSWLGSANKLKNAGFNTSEYYDEQWAEGFTLVTKELQRNERCTTCGN